MIDENAFGILISYCSVENDEYACERDEFVQRFETFEATVLAFLKREPIATDLHVVLLGHAVYVEFAEPEEQPDLFAWLRTLREDLAASDFESAVALAHGSRWIDEESGAPPSAVDDDEDMTIVTVSAPSEPLRRTLDADAMARRADAEDEVAWGPGLYVDTEALEALGRAPKNTPTPLRAGTGTFFRVSR
jgi:hypothetical protein